MSKFVPDSKQIQDSAQAINGLLGEMVKTDCELRTQIKTLSTFVKEAMQFSEATDTIWKEEAEAFLQSLEKNAIDSENDRFNRQNGHPARKIVPIIEDTPAIEALSQPQSRYQQAALDAKLNEMEAGFGPEMDEEALARHFGEIAPGPVTKDRLKKPLNKMNLQEIEDMETAQDNATDIYKISARIMNLARGDAGRSLGQQQTMLCNSFCHVVKAFYDFADTIRDKELKKRLVTLTRAQESVPANIISAALSQVKESRKK